MTVPPTDVYDSLGPVIGDWCWKTVLRGLLGGATAIRIWEDRLEGPHYPMVLGSCGLKKVSKRAVRPRVPGNTCGLETWRAPDR